MDLRTPFELINFVMWIWVFSFINVNINTNSWSLLPFVTITLLISISGYLLCKNVIDKCFIKEI